MPHTVLVTETLDDACAQWLAERVDLVWCAHDAPDFQEKLQTADALVVRTYTQVNAELLAAAPNVKVVGRAGVGLDNFDLPACSDAGVRVVYTPDANTQAVVEYVTGLILDHIRPRTAMPPGVSAEQFHDLRKTQVGLELADLTLGILGVGRIGKRLARAAVGLGMRRILGNDIVDQPEAPPEVRFVDKQTLYRESDILTVHADGRAANHHLIDAAALMQMKSDCLLINAARGMLVDAAALAAWARANQNAAAVLDVHDPEPPPPDYALYGLPNVRLLPHLASRTDTALQNMSWVVKDVFAVLEGDEPEFLAN